MSKRTVRHRALILAVATATTLTACSSTNDKPSAQPGGAEQGADAGTSASTAPVPTPTGADGKPLTSKQIVAAVKAGKLPASALGRTAPPAAGSGPVATGGSKGSATTGAPGGTARGVSAGKSGPGFSATEIKIGVTLFDPGSAADNLGMDATYGDTEKQAAAVVNYVNEHGGIAGRKLKPVYYKVDFGRTDYSQTDQFEAEACEKWANDDRVFAAINNAMARVSLLTCLGKKGVPGVHDGMAISEERLGPYRDFYYAGAGIAAITYDRMATAIPKSLAARGFYTSGEKPTVVGILHFDEPALNNVVNKKMVPMLKSLGVKKVVTQASTWAAQANHASFVSRFQAEGVTHIHMLGESNLMPTFFMPAAENQQYRPKYALSTDHFPGFLETTTPIPREQLGNSMGTGWSQLLDVTNANDPGPTGPNDSLCLDIQKRAGQSMSDRGARLTASMVCNGLFFLKQTLDAAPELSTAGLANAAAALGAKYSSPGAFNPTLYTATKHDGGGAYREFAFRNGSFVYTSGVKRLPQ